MQQRGTRDTLRTGHAQYSYRVRGGTICERYAKSRESKEYVALPTLEMLPIDHGQPGHCDHTFARA